MPSVVGSSRNCASGSGSLEEAGAAADGYIAAVVPAAAAGVPSGAGASLQPGLAAAAPGPRQPDGALAWGGRAPESFVGELQLAAHHSGVRLAKPIGAHGAPVAVVPDLLVTMMKKE